MMSDVVESIQQGLLLSTLLAGFSITARVQLIALGKSGKTASAVIVAFLVVVAFTLISILGGVLAQAAARGFGGLDHALTVSELSSFSVAVSNWALLGFVALLVGVGLMGWLHSRRVGIVSALLMALSLLVVLSMLLRLIRLQSD
jgi:hypothetical protein